MADNALVGQLRMEEPLSGYFMTPGMVMTVGQSVKQTYGYPIAE